MAKNEEMIKRRETRKQNMQIAKSKQRKPQREQTEQAKQARLTRFSFRRRFDQILRENKQREEN